MQTMNAYNHISLCTTICSIHGEMWTKMHDQTSQFIREFVRFLLINFVLGQVEVVVCFFFFGFITGKDWIYPHACVLLFTFFLSSTVKLHTFHLYYLSSSSFVVEINNTINFIRGFISKWPIYKTRNGFSLVLRLSFSFAFIQF